MTRAELFEKLRPIIELITGYDGAVIPADPNAPAPSGAYCSVEPMQSVRTIGQIVVDANGQNRDVDTEVRSQKVATVSINFYRGDAQSAANTLDRCNFRPDVSMALFRENIGWLGMGPVQNLNSLVSGNVESRAQTTVQISYQHVQQSTVNAIESVGLEVQNEDGETIYEYDIIS